MKKSTLLQIIESNKRKQSIALVTNLDKNSQEIFLRNDLIRSSPLQIRIAEAFSTDRSGLVQLHEGRFFIQIFNVPLRLLIIGAVHIAKPLIAMAQECAYDVTLIDPRRAFASEDRFPSVALINEWPDTALEKLGLDERTAVVTLTHDPKLDEPALVTAIRSDAFYIGALGSKRTHKQRCHRLLDAGITEAQLRRICAPVGLNISAKSPAEIAVAIMAQITQKLREQATK